MLGKSSLCAAIIFIFASVFLYHNVSDREPHCDIDSKAYLERGALFYTTNRFVTPLHPQQPYYALGYAFVIGMAYKIFGQSMAVIIALQVLLSLISCFLIMCITRRFFGGWAVSVAAVFFALNVGYLTFTQFVLTEILLSFFLVLFFERMTAYLQEQKFSQLITAGLALGTSIMVKPAAIYFVFVVCGLLLAFAQGAWFKRFGIAAMFALSFYIPVLGYMTYNYHAFGNFCVSTLDRVNMYYWFFPNVLATENNTTSDIERTKLLALSEGSHNFDAVQDLFFQKLQQRPILFVRVWLTNVFKTMVGLYTTNLKVLVEPHVHGGAISFFKMQGGVLTKAWAYIAAGASKPWVVAVGFCEALWSVLRYLLCLLGLVMLFRSRKIELLLLALAFIAYFALITGHDGCARFRMMFEFLLIVLAAGGACIRKSRAIH